VIAAWGGRSDGKSSLIVVGGERNMDGSAMKVSFDGCKTWELLGNKSLFSWEYGAPGPVVDAWGDTIVVYAAPGPDLGVGTTFNFYASIDAGATWTEITPADVSTSSGRLPGSRFAANPSGALVDRVNTKMIWLSFGGRSDAVVTFD